MCWFVGEILYNPLQIMMIIKFSKIEGKSTMVIGNPFIQPASLHISSCECKKAVSAFCLFCRRCRFVFKFLYFLFLLSKVELNLEVRVFTCRKLHFTKMSVTTLLHLHDFICYYCCTVF